MIQLMSTLFLRTLRQDPADAEFPSHKLLVRAGYIRRAAPGVYSWLPLGLRVVAKIEAIVREEMNAIGSQEVRFPVLLPREPYEATGRWTEYGDNLFRLKDRRDTDMLLGPTHEEMFTLLVKDMCSSYKDLPLNLYQIQTKMRDEARPRAGLIRGREFIMKDAYTFDMDLAGLQAQYAAIRGAYQKVFDRLGFHYVIVKAFAGAMGGSVSEEFQAISPNGEDTFAYSDGGYAANIEAVVTPAPPAVDAAGAPPAHVEPTPHASTIDDLVACANETLPRSDRDWASTDMLKSLVVMVKQLDGTRAPLVIGLPGDREVDEKRLEAALSPAEPQPFVEEDFEHYPALVKGFIGPVKAGAQWLGLEGASQIRYVVDPRVVAGTTWVSGANEPGKHTFGLVAGRDFTWDAILDVAEVRDGDSAPDGSGPLKLARGIEIGHIFQLGYKYSDALDLKVLDANGKLVTVIMGSYGLGISRAVAAVAEDTYDEKGLCWPRAIAPYDVQIVVAGKDAALLEAATALAGELDQVGVSVLLDDRAATPGVKFADAELLGMPTIVVVGRGLADGQIEIRDRRTGTARNVPVADGVQEVLAAIA